MAAKPVVGPKDAVLAVDKAIDPTNTVPAKSATPKTDPAANNPNAGGTAGSPNPKKPDPLQLAKVEPKVVQGDQTGGQSKNPAKVATPKPETKKPTEGPTESSKVGTGGTGTGNGSGTGNGNGSEKGVQGNST